MKHGKKILAVWAGMIGVVVAAAIAAAWPKKVHAPGIDPEQEG